MAKQPLFSRRPIGGGPAPVYCNSYRKWTKASAIGCAIVSFSSLAILIITNLVDLAGACTTKLMTNLETISTVFSVFFSAAFSAYLYVMASSRWFSDEEIQVMTYISVGAVFVVCLLGGLDAWWVLQIIDAQRLCTEWMIASYVRFGFKLAGTLSVAIISVLILAKTLSEILQQQQVLMTIF